ncbi:GNAT family N-acetyltransferase [Blautia sp.]|uniref:GNAT family N-acetyltransferase n=1 Tax=Blautia sp. TaxID=1955243 RepID=UPI00262EF380|nr:GNAT family N-acetyltransferase [Blautia sp.]
MHKSITTIKDKQDREIILRSAEEKDAESLLDFLKITAAETPFLLREPDEITLSIEQEQDFIKAKKDSENEILLIAEIEGKHIGNCSLMSVGGFRRYRHRCEIAIALYQEYCGLGIGKAMLEMLLDIAKQVGYEQAELEVIANNKSAIALYEKLGFLKYGTFPNNMKYADGSYADAYWMMKKL